MIGLALSGGGSRAIAFHLGCLRALNDLEILEQVGAISTISGGSVIGAYYAYTPHKSFREFEADIRTFLRQGFQTQIGFKLGNPVNLFQCMATGLAAQLHDLTARLSKCDLKVRRFPSRTDMFCKVLSEFVFPNLQMSSPRRKNLEVVIGACELRTGSSFRFGNSKSGSWRHGEMIEGDVEVAFAVAASAAYPILLPALDRNWQFRKNGNAKDHRVLLTDGGVYDNLGIQVLEPNRDPAVSLHTFPCEYLIVCNAGHGQESGQDMPLGFLTRISKSFSIVHRRVQDSAMNRLHHLHESGAIKGFILPYLGQQDERLPYQPPTLVSRHEVIQYPTNFGAMSEEWITKLSDRGEQLTRALATHYLRDLLN